MAQSNGPISPENLSTVAAVAAVLAILSLVYGLYLHRELSVVAVAAAANDGKVAQYTTEMNKQVKDLQDRITALEARPVADPAMTAALPTPEAAPAK
jgi:hypothetical protein